MNRITTAALVIILMSVGAHAHNCKNAEKTAKKEWKYVSIKKIEKVWENYDKSKPGPEWTKSELAPEAKK